VSDLEKIERTKRRVERTSFQKGVAEGWNQAAWLLLGLLAVAYFLNEMGWFG
jgi:hypothetical protein